MLQVEPGMARHLRRTRRSVAAKLRPKAEPRADASAGGRTTEAEPTEEAVLLRLILGVAVTGVVAIALIVWGVVAALS